MQYAIEFRPAVLKCLKRFPKWDLTRIKKTTEELGTNLPNPDTTKMKGENSFHKIRCNFSITGGTTFFGRVDRFHQITRESDG